MSFPRYERYKDSGVEWLGEVPEGWEVKRLGYFFNERREKVSDKDFEPLSVTKNGILPQLETAAKSDDGDNRKKVCAGDFVINSRSDRKGSSGMAVQDGSISLINTVIQPYEDITILFAHHLLRSVPFQEEYYRYGKGIVADLWSTNYSEMRNIMLAMPPLPEQQTISTFLDCETGKIDELVAEQERLIALLKEKRQAVISHAVTKGLNPEAAMKNSGIEWLGAVPEGWEVTSFKRIASIRYGIGEPPKYQEEGTPLIRATNVNAGLVTQEGMVFVNPDDIPEKRIIWLSAGDIIVVRSGAYTGDSAIIRSEHCPCIAGFDMVVHPNACLPFFLQYALLSTYLKNDQLDLEKTRAAQPHLNAEELGSCVVVLPPSKEQSAIVAFLDSETAKIDTLVGEARQAIGLLKERRSALISAAVTGKIDVRNSDRSDKSDLSEGFRQTP